jgi:hypothetical protein
MDNREDHNVISLNVKEIRYRSHRDFLETCLPKNVVPKGFDFKWDIQLDVEVDLQDKYNTIKKDASLKLVEVAIEGCKMKIAC